MATVSRRVLGLLVGLAGVTAVVAAASRSSSQNEIRTTLLPAPQADAPLASASTPATAVVAGGCFWGIEAVFDHVRGVKTAVSGYSGGAKETAHYQMVGNGRTGHAESVQISYDSSVVTYGQLLQIFFSVHDPTQLNRQGPDEGTEYRIRDFRRGRRAGASRARVHRAARGRLACSGVASSPTSRRSKGSTPRRRTTRITRPCIRTTRTSASTTRRRSSRCASSFRPSTRRGDR